ncbi:MAG: L,D-transpeptidase Cds6 family protein, partial [Burkholderiaceae bacterium]
LGTEPSLSDVRDSVEQWRQSWESRQAAAYVEFYHPRFPGLTGFARQKNSVMGRAQFIEVKVSDLKLSLEPGFTKAEFKQHYKSNTYESFDVKTQHWVMTNSGPRIIEETIRSLSR